MGDISGDEGEGLDIRRLYIGSDYIGVTPSGNFFILGSVNVNNLYAGSEIYQGTNPLIVTGSTREQNVDSDGNINQSAHHKAWDYTGSSWEKVAWNSTDSGLVIHIGGGNLINFTAYQNDVLKQTNPTFINFSGNLVSSVQSSGAGVNVYISGTTGGGIEFPSGATFITTSANSNLYNERVLLAGSGGISIVEVAGNPGSIIIHQLDISGGTITDKVPYSGAVSGVDLGTNYLFTTGSIVGGIGSILGNQWVQTQQVGNTSHNIQLSQSGLVYIGSARPKKSIILTAAGGWASSVSGCATNTKTSFISGQSIYSLDFDQSGTEYAEWSITMPDSYDGGTVTSQIYWNYASGTSLSGNVVWGIQGICYNDTEAINQNFGTTQTIGDSGTAYNTLYISPVSSAITLAGTPTGGEFAQFRVYRDAGSVIDTLNTDARLLAVKIEYTITQESD